MDIRNSPASDKSVSLKTEMRNHDFVETWKKQVGSEEAREISLHRILYCHEYTSMKWLTSHNSHPSMCSLYTHNIIPLMQVAYENLVCGHLSCCSLPQQTQVIFRADLPSHLHTSSNSVQSPGSIVNVIPLNTIVYDIYMGTLK